MIDPARRLFDRALHCARDWHAELTAASTFCPWPTDLRWCARPPQILAATSQLQSNPGLAAPTAEPLLQALQALSPHLDWRQTYSAQQVGQHFLDNYGWFELVGPLGHFHSRQTRITAGYWGPGLAYGRHQHQAEELYTIVSGKALFHADGADDMPLSSGGSRMHSSNQAHAMTTTNSPLLALIFWRGTGLDDAPAMSA